MPRAVTDKLTPAGKRFFEELQKLAKLEVQAGFTAGKSGKGKNHESVSAKDYDDGPTIAEVAAWNEFGTKNKDGSQRIPARPFMSQSVENNKDVIATMCEEQLKAIAEGKTDADKAIRAVGALQVGLIQHEIREGGFADNAKSTGERKGSSVPLIDEGRMRQSIHYVVKQRKG